jgi:hypothetical protein
MRRTARWLYLHNNVLFNIILDIILDKNVKHLTLTTLYVPVIFRERLTMKRIFKLFNAITLSTKNASPQVLGTFSISPGKLENSKM